MSDQISNHTSLALTFDLPPTGPAVLTLYLMSDSYLGLDQQYDIPFRVIPATRHEEEEEEEEEEQEEEEEHGGNDDVSGKKWLPPAPGMAVVWS